MSAPRRALGVVTCTFAAELVVASCASYGEQSIATEAGASVDAAIERIAETSFDAPSDVTANADADATVDSPCNGGVDCSRIMFVTRSQKTGNLGGLVGADALCNAEAASSILAHVRNRKYVAWLSTQNAPAHARHIHSSQPYRLPSGGVVAANWGVLTSGGVSHLVEEDQDGKLLGIAIVWTGTTSSGTSTNASCNGWITPGASGTVGSTADSDVDWTDLRIDPCDLLRHVYCIER